MALAAERLRTRLADSFPSAWRAIAARVPRHAFIPDTVWIEDGDGPVPIRRGDDPERWLDACYADRPLITQLDDGDDSGRGYITSSASKPSIVADMLQAAEVRPGMRVLEIGSGTGWNAALLAARTGPDRVTTIEVDPSLADHARRSLGAAGWRVAVVTGDGTRGHAPGAPFDRVLSTAAVQRVPSAWVEQTAAGGQILTPWGTTFHNGVLARLAVHGDGTASGRFTGNAAFMWIRGQRRPHAVVEEQVLPEHDYTEHRTDLHPYEPIGDFDARFAIGLRMPTGAGEVVVFDGDRPGDPNFTVYLMAPETGSWAEWRITPDSAGAYRVRQHGPRRLFDELCAAYQWWQRLGRPRRDRFGLTATTGGDQTVWIDDPAHPASETDRH
ncbi:methyltransferase domain-containing protein [Nocardiopsis mangrovi]|uniref:Protein-L-isoaspartate O-methyltransferase n=1 Tax=Nocardiopsis mangrovi TaxID=1179818 RepID=A0ABV9DPM0_9ACTN